jgi:hypothetical protein
VVEIVVGESWHAIRDGEEPTVLDGFSGAERSPNRDGDDAICRSLERRDPCRPLRELGAHQRRFTCHPVGDEHDDLASVGARAGAAQHRRRGCHCRAAAAVRLLGGTTTHSRAVRSGHCRNSDLYRTVAAVRRKVERNDSF